MDDVGGAFTRGSPLRWPALPLDTHDAAWVSVSRITSHLPPAADATRPTNSSIIKQTNKIMSSLLAHRSSAAHQSIVTQSADVQSTNRVMYEIHFKSCATEPNKKRRRTRQLVEQKKLSKKSRAVRELHDHEAAPTDRDKP